MLASVACTVLNVLVWLVFWEVSMLAPLPQVPRDAHADGSTPLPAAPTHALSAAPLLADDDRPARRPTFVVGVCTGDTHDWVPKVLGPLIFPEAQTTIVHVESNGDEAAVDLMMCYRGATAVVARKAARPGVEWLRGRVAKMARAPWSTGGGRSDGPGAWRDGVWWPTKAALLRAVGTGRPVAPFVLRMNTEPWPTGVDGVDLMLDCKTAPANFHTTAPTLFLPYAFAGFGMRFADRLEDLVLARDATQRASTARAIARGKTKFCAFIASYCSARVPSAAMRSVAFDMLADIMGKPPDALGNCRPRRATTKGRLLKVAGHFVNGTLDEVVAACVLRCLDRCALARRCGPPLGSACASTLARTELTRDTPPLPLHTRRYRPYKFALCFENSQLGGYVTEKIVSAAVRLHCAARGREGARARARACARACSCVRACVSGVC